MSIYLIPIPIAEGKITSIPSSTIHKTHSINHFIVERAKTSRRWLRSIDHPTMIDDMEIFELNKHQPEEGLIPYLEEFAKNNDIGVMSESGCPGIADPGSLVAEWAHKKGIRVTPLVGPSSIIMSLMASGFNGQEFRFHGYLPNKKPALTQTLRILEQEAIKKGISQIFIEAPYRNKFMIENCIEALSDDTKICIALDINGENENIKTQKIKQWKNVDYEKYHKIPAVFIIGK